MALNWTMLDPNGSPVPLPHENTILSALPGAELSLSIPNAPPSASSTAGGSGGTKKLKESGRLWLTDQRLIFATVSSGKPSLESLSVPLHAILATKFEQPFFGANYLALEIKPSSEGGLTEGTKAEVRLQDQGIFGFVSTLEKTRERAIYMRRQAAEEEEEGLPMYTSPTEAGSSTPFSISQDNPPGYDA